MEVVCDARDGGCDDGHVEGNQEHGHDQGNDNES